MKPLDPFSVPITGVELVDASAGTGKTHTIATLFLRLVLERSLDVDRILVVTFTKAATAELRDRIRRRLAEALAAFERGDAGSDDTLAGLLTHTRDHRRAARRLERAVASADEAAVLTIHGFCQRMLEEHAFESGSRFDLSLVPDMGPLVIEIVQDFWNRRLPVASREIVGYFRQRRKFPDLVRLALLGARTRDVPVVAAAQPDDVEGRIGSFLRARSALVAEWRSGRDAAVALLHGSTSLNRNRYSSRICIRLVECMDAFEGARAEFGAFDPELVKLSASELKAGVTRGGAPPRHAVFDRCDEMMKAWRDAESALAAWCEAFERDLVLFVREELPARARARGILSFDDVLHDMQRALSGPNGKTLAATVRRRFPAAVIDEFHDTDPVQYDIFRRIYRAPNTSLFLIGDPKQAIYAFRGADVYAYIAASRDADHRFTLSTNHRSDPTLIRAVNTVFSRADAPFVLDEIRFEPVRPKKGAADELRASGAPASGLEILFVRRDSESGGEGAAAKSGRSRRGPSIDAIPEIVARDIAALLASGATLRGRPIRAGDIAVLTRRNAEARDVQTALRALGVTGVLHGDSSVLDTEEAAETAAVLRALADPANPTAVRSALATSLLGQSATELFELGEDENAWERWTSDFGRWHELWKTRGILAAARRLMADRRAAARLLGAPGGERHLTNFVHLVELLHKHATEEHAGMAGLIAWFDEVRHEEDARGGVAPEAQQVRLESDELAVQLTTMHRSKGLEYPIVYLPYLWRGAALYSNDKRNLLYHDRAHDHRLVLDLRAEDQKRAELAQASEESLAEAQRLTYVALTRAKHRAVVVWGAFLSFQESSLARLLHPRLLDASGKTPDADLLRELDDLASTAEGAITIRALANAEVPAEPRHAPVHVELRAKPLPSRRLLLRRTSSFTGLSSGADAPEAPVDDARDVADASVPPSAREAAVRAAVEDAAAARIPLDDFPRGPRAGDALHGILERIDFERRDPDELERVTREGLASQGIDATAWCSPVARALDGVLRTPLVDGTPSFSLADIPNGRKSAEMEFTFCVGSRSENRHRPLTANTLAEALRGCARLPGGYAERVAALPFTPLSGFLRGFVDLVFERGGRFYVVDYKSNHLGRAPDDYTPDALVRPMADHHYFLQYHLYAVAVHRFLGNRIRGYEYRRHFGGVFYLFLRGMSPESGARTGIFFDRPTEATIDALSRALDAGGGAR